MDPGNRAVKGDVWEANVHGGERAPNPTEEEEGEGEREGSHSDQTKTESHETSADVRVTPRAKGRGMVMMGKRDEKFVVAVIKKFQRK
jgi:hypothetical protein